MTELSSIMGSKQATWLVTGAAGFIGSNLCIALLKAGQTVRGFDNYSTGHRHNIADIKLVDSALAKSQFTMIEADICDLEACKAALQDVDYVLHQAALGSVPRSIATPLVSHQANVTGFVTLLHASAQARVKKFVYASSSSVYGDSAELPKVELRTGALLSPYAATKSINETYASVFQRNYGIECVGLRYFNVFGPRQDPNGPYAAVIPKWISGLLQNAVIKINGDGSTSRDFCYIGNVIQANVRAALTPSLDQNSKVFNIAFGDRTTLSHLLDGLKTSLAEALSIPVSELTSRIEHAAFRDGDVLHSLANTDAARDVIGYVPTHSLSQGLAITTPWYVANQDRLK